MACRTLKIREQQLSKPCDTRWNSSSELCHDGIELQPALDRLVVQADFNKPGGNQLRRFLMSPAEWQILRELAPTLDVSRTLILLFDFILTYSRQIITYATKEVSRASVPLVHEVIPIIDVLTNHFDSVIDNTRLHPVVRAAALRGLIMLNKYYAKSDESVVYRIAMILHPAFKLDYFTKARWEVEWIAEAKRVITEVWVRDFKPASVATAAHPSASSSSSSSVSDVSSILYCSIILQLMSCVEIL